MLNKNKRLTFHDIPDLYRSIQTALFLTRRLSIEKIINVYP